MNNMNFKNLVTEAEAHVRNGISHKRICIQSGNFSILGHKFENLAEWYLDNLHKKYGESLPTVIAEAHRVTHVAVRVDLLQNEKNAECQSISWAFVACSYLVEKTVTSELFHDIESRSEVCHFLDCMALCFLFLASTHSLLGEIKASNSCIFEAVEAQRLSNAISDSGKTSKEVLSDFARSGAAARHKENHSMKQDVFLWCENNMTNYRSMDAAASAIVDGKVVPVVFRTVRAWVGEWKRLQSAGKP